MVGSDKTQWSDYVHCWFFAMPRSSPSSCLYFDTNTPTLGSIRMSRKTLSSARTTYSILGHQSVPTCNTRWAKLWCLTDTNSMLTQLGCGTACTTAVYWSLGTHVLTCIPSQITMLSALYCRSAGSKTLSVLEHWMLWVVWFLYWLLFDSVAHWQQKYINFLLLTV